VVTSGIIDGIGDPVRARIGNAGAELTDESSLGGVAVPDVPAFVVPATVRRPHGLSPACTGLPTVEYVLCT
jgi:hypothetical protein